MQTKWKKNSKKCSKNGKKSPFLYYSSYLLCILCGNVIYARVFIFDQSQLNLFWTITSCLVPFWPITKSSHIWPIIAHLISFRPITYSLITFGQSLPLLTNHSPPCSIPTNHLQSHHIWPITTHLIPFWPINYNLLTFDQ